MLCRLLSRLDRVRFNAKVITLVDLGETLNRREIQGMGISVTSLAMKLGRPSLLSVLRLACLLRKEQPDLVSTWLYHSDLIGGVAAWWAGGIPVVWGIRQSDLDPGTTKRLTRLTISMCAKLSSWLPVRIICCAESARRLHARAGYAEEKMVVIPNGYDMNAFKPDMDAREVLRAELGIPREALIVGLVGRFHPVKDHRNFIQAAQLVHLQKPEAYYVLCGYAIDWENKDLVGLIEEAGIRDRVRLLGQRRDVPKVTAAFDIACLSSCVEGFPNVVSEAMSCAVPCVVTDVGEAAFIVGQTGRVVQPRNPNALAMALLELIELGSDDRRRLGNAARQRISEHFDLTKIVRQYEQVFEEIVCDNNRNR